jgi:hypothetical protein
MLFVEQIYLHIAIINFIRKPVRKRLINPKVRSSINVGSPPRRESIDAIPAPIENLAKDYQRIIYDLKTPFPKG